MRKLRASGAAVAAVAFTVALATPAQAQTTQDGLVNVNVENNEILNDLSIGVAAQVAAEVCGVKVGPVAVLGRAVDRSGETSTVCETDQGPVELVQN